MFHQLKNIGDTLRPVEEVSYPLNVINAYCDTHYKKKDG